MIKKIAAWLGAILGLLVAVVVLWIGVAIMFFAHSSAGTTLAGGCAVAATADSIYMGIETNANTAIIRTARRTIVVTPTTLTVDGHLAGMVPPATKSIDVTVKNGKVTFSADQKPLKSTR